MASLLVRDTLNPGLVLCIVFVSVVVEFVQTRRSEPSADGLKAQVAETASVLRDGHVSEIPRWVIVPGDESLLFSVALAVGLTPEFLPMITT